MNGVRSTPRPHSVAHSCHGSDVREPTIRRDVYETYWRFAAERQRIFDRRLTGSWVPETEDPILQRHRFCNVFRAADRVTQHLIQHAAFGADELTEQDLFLRIVLHRLFCRPSTWELLTDRVGRIDASTFSPASFDAILEEARARGQKLYTSAFILCATSVYGHRRKHRNHLALIEAMLGSGAPQRVAAAGSLREVYEELLSWPLIGPFMAYQLAIDLNYSPLVAFSENDFTVPGPGALRGLRKVFLDLGDYSEAAAVHWLVSRQDAAALELGVTAPRLFGRELHAIDCQNLLCEVDKYCRVAFPELPSARQTIKQRYIYGPAPYKLHFPPEWGLNELLPPRWRHRVDDPAPV